MALKQELCMAKVTTVYHTPPVRETLLIITGTKALRAYTDTSVALELLIAVGSLVGHLCSFKQRSECEGHWQWYQVWSVEG